MIMSEFNSKIREWLLPLNFVEIYKINHPTENKNEVHFIKNGIRVCCVKDFKEEYFYLNAEVYLIPEKEVLTIKTGKEFLLNEKFLFDTEKVNRLMKIVRNKKDILEKKGFWTKLRRFFN